MRFTPKGPSLPGELLIARDQGRVVFFCGSGVSYARANLSDFYQLAQKTCDALRVPESNPARKLLAHTKKLERKTGTTGLVSMDRVFGLLERDFDSRTINKVVAESLRSAPDVDLSAHHTLLQLATTPEKKIQLVTTNFDRLFTDCSPTPEPWVAPKLPNLSIQEELNGVVYLHGRVTKDYDGAESGFVLSSSEFGRAYLSDGWATDFFKVILSKYLVVFIGYSADDPPISYLLEALNTASTLSKQIYVFQPGNKEADLAKWKHKGVTPIPYSNKNNHSALWETLTAWADRANDIGGWYDKVIGEARKRPSRLSFYKRGQVAHTISSTEGARKFANSTPPPPAEWLCVFDAHCRYAKPDRTDSSIFGEAKIVDPFQRYRLDSDTRIPTENTSSNRVDWIEKNAWNGLRTNESDWQELEEKNLPKLTGHYPTSQPDLPPRLQKLGDWLTKVADQPAFIWWAARQNELHPDILQKIYWEFPQITTSGSTLAWKAWKYLAEVWKERHRDSLSEMDELRQAIARDGWNILVVRRFAETHKPYLKIETYFGRPVPPDALKFLRDVLPLSVAYPDFHNQEFSIPNEFLAPFCEALRKNLEYATLLEKEIEHYERQTLAPIIPDDTMGVVTYHRKEGLSGSMLFFTKYFERLVSADPGAARREFSRWDTTDDKVFGRLQIWASGLNSFFSDQEAGEIILGVSDTVFWHYQHQRDLLLTLVKRWATFPLEIRKSIEGRLLGGRRKWHDNEEDFEKSNAWGILNRLIWLSNQGCRYSFDLLVTMSELQQIVPDWKAEYANKAAESHEPRAGIIQTEDDYTILLEVPFSETLSRATEIYQDRENFFVKRNPFLGLCTKCPARALRVLNHVARKGEFPKWAWRTFFDINARENDALKLSELIARRLLTYPPDKLSIIANEITWWLSNISNTLAKSHPELLNDLFIKFIVTIKNDVSFKLDRWMDASRSPVGYIADALIKASRNDDKTFSEKWFSHINSLLADGLATRNHALSCFSKHLSELYTYFPDWAEAAIIPALLARDKHEHHAAWDGLLRSGNIQCEKLYARLAPEILSLAVTNKQKHRMEILANIVLQGWFSINHDTGASFISDADIHNVLLNASENFREYALLQIKHWLIEKEVEETAHWYQLIPKFFNDIWPKQKYIRNEKTTSILCDIAFADKKRFPEIVDILLPHLSHINKQYFYKKLLRGEPLIDNYPEQILRIIFTVLPENARNWPYDTDKILSRIEQADSKLTSDSRLVELKRRWTAR